MIGYPLSVKFSYRGNYTSGCIDSKEVIVIVHSEAEFNGSILTCRESDLG